MKVDTVIYYPRMKSTFTIPELVDEAVKHEEIARRYRSIATSLSGLNPNIAIVIPMTGGEEGKRDLSERLPQMDTHTGDGNAPTMLSVLTQVLKESGKAMSKYALLEALEERGHPMKIETLTSYLSRGKNKTFKNPRRGIWKLKEQTQSPNGSADSTPAEP